MISLQAYMDKQGVDAAVLDQLGVRSGVEKLYASLTPKSDIREVNLISSQIQGLILTAINDGNNFVQINLATKSTGEEQAEEVEPDVNEEDIILRPTYIRGTKIEASISGTANVHKIIGNLEVDPIYTVKSVTAKEMKIRPTAPYITSTLQQAASSKLGLNPKITMQIAQKLYEGVEINGQNQALITYMRTDSVTISKDALASIKSYIDNKFPEYNFDGIRTYKSRSKNAQEAHEAIRPTNPLLSPEQLKSSIEPRLLKVYDLIWRQAIASQMADEIREITTFELANDIDNRFTGSHTQTVFLGHKALWRNN
ncbi:MAG: hypothetical protein H7230_01355 [Candidatus Parcubacteria bacterium]|nr:hypothetical protein [Candidatus Paceibacterota bacterium]